MNKVAFKADIGSQNPISSKAAIEDSDKELDEIISDDDHISHSVPDSGVKIFNPLANKSQPTEEAELVPKNPIPKVTRKEKSASPGTRVSPPKANITVTEQNESENVEKSKNPKPKPKKLDKNDPEFLKKLIYSKSPKKAAEDYLQATQKKLLEQNTKGSQQRSTISSNKNEKTLPYGLNTGASPEKDKDAKGEDAKVEYDSAYTELSKKLYLQKLHQQPGVRSMTYVNAPNYEMLLSPYAAKEIENRKNVASKDLQDAIANRLQKHGEALNEHSKALIEAYLEKEYEECTFNPKITAYGNYENKRSKEQFLNDQKKFVESVEAKRQKIKNKVAAEQKLTEGTYKPELCKKSLKILAKKKKLTGAADEDAHSRLYKVNKNAQQKQMLDFALGEENEANDSNASSSQYIGNLSRTTQKHLEEAEKNATFKPNIQKKSKEMKREIKVDAVLYSDAMRRQRKNLEVTKKLNKKNAPSSKSISDGSRRALAQRFVREFEIMIADIIGPDQEQKLDYIQLNELLKRLSFLKDAEDIENPQFTPERILLHDMWFTLYADKYKGVHRRNLLLFSIGVLGLHFEITKIHESDVNEPKPNESGNNEDSVEKKSFEREITGPPEQEGMPPRERKIIGQFDEEGNLELTPDDVEKIYKVYHLWFLNRLSSKDNLAQLATGKKQEEVSYHPVINENSKNMAHLHRERILEGTSELIQMNKIPAPKDGKLTHADLLVLSKKVVKEKIERMKEKVEGNELQNCPFKPVTNEYSRKKKDSQIEEEDEEGKSKNLGVNRSNELYALRKTANNKKDRDPVEIEYGKEADECTFQPDTKMTKDKRFDAGPSTIMAKNIEKTIQRMRYANEIREMKNLQNQRGFYPQQTHQGLSFSIEKDSKFKQSSQTSSVKGSTKKSTRPASIGQSLWDKQPSNIEAQLFMYDTNGKQDDQSDPDNQGDHRYVDDQGNDVGNHGDEMHIGNAYGDGQQEGEENERVPLLFVDVNLGQGKSERITVFEGDRSEDLARKFAEEHGLDDVMTGKLKELLDSQIAGLLTRIDEELNSLQSDTDKLDQQGNIEVYRQGEQIEEEEDQEEEDHEEENQEEEEQQEEEQEEQEEQEYQEDEEDQGEQQQEEDQDEDAE